MMKILVVQLATASIICYISTVPVWGFVVIPSSTKQTTSSRKQRLLFFTALKAEKNRGFEGSDRDKWEFDLLDTGGDPAFLPDNVDGEDSWYDDAIKEEEEIEMPSMSLLGMAGTPSILTSVVQGEEDNESDEEWDGVEIEDAFFD